MSKPPVQRRAIYKPPKPQRWHEELTWTTLILSPMAVVAAIFTKLTNRLPGHAARLTVFAGLGLTLGGLVGWSTGDGWWRVLEAAGSFACLGMLIYGVLAYLNRGGPNREMTWGDAMIATGLCIASAVIASVLLLKNV